MKKTDWVAEFRQVWDRAVEAWKQGRRSASGMFGAEDVGFLGRIGCSAQELFDYVDDHLTYGEPDFETVLAVTAIRRDYFLKVQRGQPTGRVGSASAIPGKHEELDSIAWLPRILAKARLKLHGELPPDLMFGCGGDRAFLARCSLSAPAFLQLVRDHEPDVRPVVAVVRRQWGQPA